MFTWSDTCVMVTGFVSQNDGSKVITLTGHLQKSVLATDSIQDEISQHVVNILRSESQCLKSRLQITISPDNIWRISVSRIWRGWLFFKEEFLEQICSSCMSNFLAQSALEERRFAFTLLWSTRHTVADAVTAECSQNHSVQNQKKQFMGLNNPNSILSPLILTSCQQMRFSPSPLGPPEHQSYTGLITRSQRRFLSYLKWRSRGGEYYSTHLLSYTLALLGR